MIVGLLLLELWRRMTGEGLDGPITRISCVHTGDAKRESNVTCPGVARPAPRMGTQNAPARGERSCRHRVKCFSHIHVLSLATPHL